MSLISCKEYFKQLKELGFNEIIIKYEKMSFGRTRAKKDLDFGNGKYPKFLLSPVICQGDITFLYAAKGIGKTLLALSMAYVVATGKSLFGFWKCPTPCPVLYLDAEVGEAGLKARIIDCRRSFGLKRNEAADVWFSSGRFNLYSEDYRNLVKKEIKRINSTYTDDREVKLIVIDNLTSMQDGKDHASNWEKFFNWATELKNSGISVLILYHANDDGTLRGDKKKLINTDNAIFISGPKKKSKEKNSADDEQEDKEDPTKMQMKIVFQHLRNNRYPEAKYPLDVKYSIPDNKWTLIDKEEHFSKVLQEQSQYNSDEEMAGFWDESSRNIREIRRKYGIRKYHKK
jgi:RecA-family ATPase